MQQIVEGIELDRLPSLPAVLLRILREFNSDNLQVRELAGLIAQDPALTLKILAAANSTIYQRRRKISSIEQCISVLGFKMVKMITISVSTQQFLNTLSGIVPVNFNQFWQHSQTVASLSEMLAESVGYPQSEEAYIAGLLHDVGKLALLVAKPQAYAPIFSGAAAGDDAPNRELGLLGVTHGEIGAMLFEHWGLEPLIGDAIRYHHEPFHRIGSASELIKIVVLANALGKMERKAVQHPALAIARALFGLDAEKALQLRARASAKTVDLATHLGMQIEDHWQPRNATGTPPPAEHDELDIQRQLAEAVRASTMLDLAHDSLGAVKTEEELLSGILKSAAALFAPRQAFLFEWNVETNQISGRPVLEDQAPLGRIRLPLAAGKSLIADALLANVVTSSCDATEYDDRFVLQKQAEAVDSMLDEQIIRMANTDCIYCAPMTTQNFMYGVLVLAFPFGAIDPLRDKLRFLAQFARQAAASIENLRHKIEVSNRSGSHDEEAFKTYARQIVHEASNPISILKNYLKLLDAKLKAGHPAELELRILNEEIDRVSGTIRKLVVPPEERSPDMGRTDVNAAIRSVAAVCDPSLFLPANIRLEAMLDDSLPAIHSDANRLKQIFINLFKNAAEAMPGGGTVKVATAPLVSQDRHDSISITISDDGPGIKPGILKNLFSPVTSTKGKANAGLGLSIVSGIVDELGGTISCRSAPALGTSFEITLPVKQQKVHRL